MAMEFGTDKSGIGLIAERRYLEIMTAHPDDLPFAELEEAAQLLAAADWAADEDRNARGIGSDAVFACAVCKSTEVVAVQFFDWRTGGYPVNRWRLAARMVCASEDEAHGYGGGYHAFFDSTVGDLPATWYDSWADHLMEKRWYDPSFRRDLERADRLWQTIRAERLRTMRAAGLAMTRRSSRGGNPRTITAVTRAMVFERDGFKCRRCGCGPDDRPLNVDHIIPVAGGGGRGLENLQTLCSLCNSGKSDRDPHDHDFRGRK